MAKVELKTKKTRASVAGFINSIKDPGQKADAKVLVKLMQEATKAKPAIWGSSIVGFGNYQYKYASGREGDWFLAGLSPRAGKTTIYLMPGYLVYGDLLKNLGKFKSAGGCLYINKLSDIHLPTLKKLIATSVRDMKKRHNA
jgi:hypothetical protein